FPMWSCGDCSHCTDADCVDAACLVVEDHHAPADLARRIALAFAIGHLKLAVSLQIRSGQHEDAVAGDHLFRAPVELGALGDPVLVYVALEVDVGPELEAALLKGVDGVAVRTAARGPVLGED